MVCCEINVELCLVVGGLGQILLMGSQWSLAVTVGSWQIPIQPPSDKYIQPSLTQKDTSLGALLSFAIENNLVDKKVIKCEFIWEKTASKTILVFQSLRIRRKHSCSRKSKRKVLKQLHYWVNGRYSSSIHKRRRCCVKFLDNVVIDRIEYISNKHWVNPESGLIWR